jgi:NADH-quinone oxidoreductase subunit G
VAEARAEMEQLGGWDGERQAIAGPRADGDRAETPAQAASTDGVVLATWKLMLDNGRMQDGDKHLRATARVPVARVSAAVFDQVGATVTLTGDRGSVTLPTEIADLADDVVWVPANSFGTGVLAGLASPGSRVTLKGANQ